MNKTIYQRLILIVLIFSLSGCSGSKLTNMIGNIFETIFEIIIGLTFFVVIIALIIAIKDIVREEKETKKYKEWIENTKDPFFQTYKIYLTKNKIEFNSENYEYFTKNKKDIIKKNKEFQKLIRQMFINFFEFEDDYKKKDIISRKLDKTNLMESDFENIQEFMLEIGGKISYYLFKNYFKFDNKDFINNLENKFFNK
ncbi:hypothetical protein CE91St25_12200 [Campylobacter ureolyticus]|uniref:hypothetical protein n=1 Tax=Campylobacter ureolyticus TaxID=827 RepID=UPI001FC8BD47|nr:hypothetical protein [Campylobacter ureolyticus]GKH60884.1 hypothetical protein CE91St25_12200 [Campylobacter ureolyticus]